MKKLMFVALAAIFSLSASMVMAQPPQGGQRGQRQQQSVEERVAQLKEQLSLSDEQCEQITALEESRAAEQGQQGQSGERPSREEMMKKMEEMQAQQSAQMKEILTEEQFTAWEKMQSERPQGGPQGGGRQR
ncbi:MAG: hypothetical protein SNG49_02865 [Rikenellaceae bacterium]